MKCKMAGACAAGRVAPHGRCLAWRRTPHRKRALTMSEKFARARASWSVVELEVTAPTSHPHATAVAVFT
jgi:hypothetical protein